MATRLLSSLGLIALASCSFGADRRLASDAVAQFHDLYNSGEYPKIYEDADPDLRKTTTEADFDNLMSAIRRKLGACKSSENQGWNVDEEFGGAQVTLTFHTVFTEGDARERFVYKLVAGKPHLLGYNINSPTLILK